MAKNSEIVYISSQSIIFSDISPWEFSIFIMYLLELAWIWWSKHLKYAALEWQIVAPFQIVTKSYMLSFI